MPMSLIFGLIGATRGATACTGGGRSKDREAEAETKMETSQNYGSEEVEELHVYASRGKNIQTVNGFV